MARTIPICSLIALAALAALAVTPAAANSGRTAYLTARAAEADGDGPAASTAYAAAVAAFATQVRAAGPLPEDAPVLPPHVLARFARDEELVFA